MSADSRRMQGSEPPDSPGAMSRLEELLADRALQGLSVEEEKELDELLARAGELDAEAFDRAAAAIDLALGEQSFEPMPASLRNRIAASTSLSSTQFRTAHHRAIAEHARSAGGTLSSTKRSTFILWSGWVAAAAAVLLILYIVELRKPTPKLGTAIPIASVDGARDKMTMPWKPTDDPDGKNVRGEIVWSNEMQCGYMRFAGLPKNDPTKRQYQLWIFDSNQDEKFPIDGGVFDVDSSMGDVVVPINAKLKVMWPKMFAVTEEKPGGVVVSAREHVVALAQT
jgi:hypothetical protein